MCICFEIKNLYIVKNERICVLKNERSNKTNKTVEERKNRMKSKYNYMFYGRMKDKKGQMI